MVINTGKMSETKSILVTEFGGYDCLKVNIFIIFKLFDNKCVAENDLYVNSVVKTISLISQNALSQ